VNAFSLRLAERVIRAADREHPGDAVLREVLKAERDLTPEQRTRVSAAVFAYFRWRGWLEPAKPLQGEIERASDLAERYAAQPLSARSARLARNRHGGHARMGAGAANAATALAARPARAGQGTGRQNGRL
jgi:hypothetical protein